MEDGGLSLRERLTAAHALTRVVTCGDALLASFVRILPSADRWLAVGLLRAAAQLCPAYPMRPEVSSQWPAWESRLAHRVPPANVESSRDALLRLLAEHLEHSDYDVRRTACLGLGFCGGAGDRAPAAAAVRAAARAARISEPLRHDVLRRLGEASELDTTGFPWDLTMVQPDLDLDAIAADCESLWARATAGAGAALDSSIGVPKWAFLRYLVERRGLLLHGSRVAGVDVLRPVSHSWGGGQTADQPGLFAVDHALMAMYFGVIDRSKVPHMSNGGSKLTSLDGKRVRGFHLGLDFVALTERPFVDATVYVVPPDTFSPMGELTNLVPVQPLAGVPIAPEDFPLLEYLWGTDLGPLGSQFTEEHPALRDVGFWATKRSALSAALSAP